MRKTGFYESIGTLQHFIPYPLPPSNPALMLTPQSTNLMGDTLFYLGKLNELAHRLPDKKRFIKAYVTKEALLSSAIEDINTTLVAAFTQPANKKPDKATQLVLNYSDALTKGVELIQQKNIPLSSRIIRTVHATLMGTTQTKGNPGHYRKQSVQVGNLIPPPAPKIDQLMSELEQYIHQDDGLPPLVKAGLVHLQFETIHPFLDGNGRVGRLLIVLMLITSNLLSEPLIYPSYYFKKNHAAYYYHLDRVRTHGDFEEWIHFYLGVMRNSTIDAYYRARAIEALDTQLQQKIASHPAFSKTQATAKKVLDALFQQPIFTITTVSQKIEMAYNTTRNMIQQFQEIAIIAEHMGSKRNKLYRFDPYLQLLEKEYTI